MKFIGLLPSRRNEENFKITITNDDTLVILLSRVWFHREYGDSTITGVKMKKGRRSNSFAKRFHCSGDRFHLIPPRVTIRLALKVDCGNFRFNYPGKICVDIGIFLFFYKGECTL